MLLTITSSEPPAEDLSFLLHKRPERVQAFALSFGQAWVYYPELSPARTSAALMVAIDPVALARGRRPGAEPWRLEPYVNDRPYAASSHLSVALGKVFSTALAGRCELRPELPARRLRLEARIPALKCSGGEDFLRALFEPLGYTVAVARGALLDERIPAWGPSPYLDLSLARTGTLQELLSHLYVLVPVLDDAKHYWVGSDEVAKLLRRGEGWLAGHPLKPAITRRYLRYRRGLEREALERLRDDEEPDEAADRNEEERLLERPLSLAQRRVEAIQAALGELGARRVIDLGCGEGRLLRALAREPALAELVGLDVSSRALAIAAQRLKLDEQPEHQKDRVQLWHGSLVYRDRRLEGFDAAVASEVIEHLDAPRLKAFERVVLECARPRALILTTPNREYNARFERLPAGGLRHRDHRFEWTRAECEAWCRRAAETHGYALRLAGVGDADPELGPPTQMAVLTRRETEEPRP